jgi:hypothetical protein
VKLSGLAFIMFALAWTVACCTIGYIIDRLCVRLGF